MKLATLANGTPDGQLVVISADGTSFLPAGETAANLQFALENWISAECELRKVAERLAREGGQPLDHAALRAPLPRAWQWLDGSAFATHGKLMQIAFDLPPVASDLPLMYQGISDKFYGPYDEIPLPSEADGIDFEGEFGVVVDAVPLGITPEQALGHIRLIVQINDWSLRAIAPVEMKTGFGWIQAKPPCSIAAFAVTPGELGNSWRDGRVCLDLAIDWNGKRFGRANGREMGFGFHELVAHAARTRNLVAGTIIGSGTVSNANYKDVGSSCISEVRAIEIIAGGGPETPFMAFGDTVRMEARSPEGAVLFGPIDQTVIRA